MNRLERITAILLMLQSRRKVTAQYMAEHFTTSVRTIYRDIRVLEEAGVPINAEAGQGYSLVDGYSLPPVMFSKAEAAAMLTGEKLVQKFGDISLNREFNAAMQKVRAVLRSGEKNFVETLDESMKVQTYRREAQPEFPDHFITRIQQALVQQQVLSIDYFSHHSKESNTRNVEPIGLCHISGHWHMIAFCRLRKDFRDFRADRLRQVNMLDEKFEKRKHQSLKEYLESMNSPESLQKIVLQVDKSLMSYFADMKHYLGLVEEKDLGKHTEMTFLHHSVPHFAGWMLMWGKKARVVSPSSLKTHLKTLSRELIEHHG